MMSFRSIILAGTAACLAACGGDSAVTAPPLVTMNPTPSPSPSPSPTPSPTPVAVTEREVDPRTVASGLVTGLSDHQIFVPGTNRRNRLFVMLPGTDAPPRVYRLIARTGAQEGYHAIGLSYPNEDAIAAVCGNSSRPDCSGEVRNEILTGQDTSPLVSVNRVNSIIGRLIDLIAFLDRSFPNEGWGQFLVNGQPDWSRIAVAGHSQGAGLAGFLGKEARLLRIGMFSGPNDPGPAAGQAALWTARPNVTPAGDQFGFTHTADPLAPIGVSSGNWQGIGLGAFGGQVSVDGRSPPFNGSRQLVTSAPPNPNPTGPTASPQHGAPAVDSVTPIAADGQPLFRPVWVHMLFAP